MTSLWSSLATTRIILHPPGGGAVKETINASQNLCKFLQDGTKKIVSVTLQTLIKQLMQNFTIFFACHQNSNVCQQRKSPGSIRVNRYFDSDRRRMKMLHTATPGKNTSSRFFAKVIKIHLKDLIWCTAAFMPSEKQQFE